MYNKKWILLYCFDICIKKISYDVFSQVETLLIVALLEA